MEKYNYDLYIKETAIAFAEQNYERSYLILNELIKRKPDDGEVYRFMGLNHANLGMVDEAIDCFQFAKKLIEDNAKKAHLDYLCGLLATKRTYNAKDANNFYNNGLSYVDESTPQNRLEKAWLYNGISFLETIITKENDNDSQEMKFEKILKRETSALKMIMNDKNKGALYLKFNLISNIAFLLEIKGDYHNAFKCFTEGFAPYVVTQIDKGRDYLKAYNYRAGMLSWKTGNKELALKLLLEAKEVATEQNDRIFLERINYGLAFVYLNLNEYQLGYDTFREGIELAL